MSEHTADYDAACSDWPGACQHTPAHDNGKWEPERSSAEDAGLVEQITRVIVEHQRIPTFKRDGENRCSGCDHLYGKTDGANSPRHAQHVAEQIVARVFPPGSGDTEGGR